MDKVEEYLDQIAHNDALMDVKVLFARAERYTVRAKTAPEHVFNFFVLDNTIIGTLTFNPFNVLIIGHSIYCLIKMRLAFRHLMSPGVEWEARSIIREAFGNIVGENVIININTEQDTPHWRNFSDWREKNKTDTMGFIIE